MYENNFIQKVMDIAYKCLDDHLTISTVSELIVDLDNNEEGKNNLRLYVRSKIRSLTEDYLPLWERLVNFVKIDEDFEKDIEDYLSSFPSLSLPIVVSLMMKASPSSLQELFEKACYDNAPDYIVFLLTFLNDIGVNYRWNTLFHRFVYDNHSEAISHVVKATGHPIEVYLAEFEYDSEDNKVIVKQIFASFDEISPDKIAEILDSTSSSDTREEAKKLHDQLPREDFPDPFVSIPPIEDLMPTLTRCDSDSYFQGTDNEILAMYCISSLRERMNIIGQEPTEEEEDIEAGIISQNGPVNSFRITIEFEEGEICGRYGGCRMFTCNCCESEEKEWFRGHCQNCKRAIPTVYNAYRMPLLDGGWKGCYCGSSCFPKGLDHKKIVKLWKEIEHDLEKKMTEEFE